MPRATPILFPSTARLLTDLGQRLALARLRRKYTSQSVADRASISRPTLIRVERGDPAVALGTYAKVLRVLGLEGDLEKLARDDELGRKLQDMDLPLRRRAPRRLRSP